MPTFSITAELANELKSLGGAARELVSQGQLDRLAEIAEQRNLALSKLQSQFPGGVIDDPDLKTVLGEVERDAQELTQVLTALRDELREALRQNQAAGRAVGAYGSR